MITDNDISKRMEKLNDFQKETITHITNVMRFIFKFKSELSQRALLHDKSKLASPEIMIFEKMPPKEKRASYGTKEYEEYSKELGIAVKHHYEVNSHHPEFFENGMNGMNLVDIIEMFCDWMAASIDHEHNGDINKSIDFSAKRFGMSDQLVDIFKNTVKIVEEK